MLHKVDERCIRDAAGFNQGATGISNASITYIPESAVADCSGEPKAAASNCRESLIHFNPALFSDRVGFFVLAYLLYWASMEAEKVADSMLEECGLGSIDAARLVLEMTENLGQLAQEKPRAELLLILRRVIHAGVQAVEREEYTVSLETAAWASVEARRERVRPVTLRDLRHYVRRILRVEGVAALQLRSISSSMCRHILREAFGRSRNSYVKGRAILHSIFAYGIRQEWCDSNPVARIEVPRIEEHQIIPLSPDDVEHLLQSARGTDMQLSLNLMLFGGIRPAEVARLKPSDIYWEEQQVIIRPRASKTGGGRVVPLRLDEDLSENLRVIPRNWQRRWRKLRHAAGFTTWVSDSCRHTFASYHASYFRNLPALQLEMGHHNLDLLRSRYMAPTLAGNARRFWECVRE